MKKKIFVLLAAAAAGMLVLTACTSSEQSSVSSSGAQNAGTGTQMGPQTGTQSVAGVPTGSEGSGSVSASSGGQGMAGQTSGTVENADSSGGSASDAAEMTPETMTEAGEPDGEVIPDEDADATENDTSAQDDEWSGTYIADEETVTITMLDEETISFSFAQSGISGTAAVDGYQAVYNGDDHHVVVFNLNDNMVDVSVSSEEDFDASGSPLIGHYVKEQ